MRGFVHLSTGQVLAMPLELTAEKAAEIREMVEKLFDGGATSMNLDRPDGGWDVIQGTHIVRVEVVAQ